MKDLSLFDQDRDGDTYDRTKDRWRLNKQHVRIYMVMRDAAWYTLGYISMVTGDPEASISARLRDFRKERFGGHVVERKRVTDGWWEYRLIWNEDVPRPMTSLI